MERIYKYEVAPKCELELPKNAQVLSAGEQGGRVFLWAKIDTNETEMEKRTFVGFGTGHDIETQDNRVFIATIHFQNGLVFHMFEEKQNITLSKQGS